MDFKNKATFDRKQKPDMSNLSNSATFDQAQLILVPWRIVENWLNKQIMMQKENINQRRQTPTWLEAIFQPCCS